MPGKLRVTSGKQVVKIFERYGCYVARTVGSHVRMVCDSKAEKHHLTIPLHSDINKKTLKSIAKDFEACFGYDARREEFYSE